MKQPDYSKITALGSTLLLFFAAQLNAQITWDGGGGNSQWNATTFPENWSDDVAPTVTDNVIVDTNTNLRAAGNWILDITGGAIAQNLTLDPNWGGTAAGKIGVRGDSALDIANNGAITITSNYTDGTSPTFGNSIGNNLFLRSAVNGGTLNFVNNSATEVSFEGGAGGNVVQLRGQGGNETTTFGGTGNFLLSTDVTLLILERVWTTDTFAGTLTLNGDAGFMAPTIDLRIQSGTIVIAANEQIEDSTIVAFGTTGTNSGTLDARGITETAGILNNFSDATATLAILADASTSLTFANFNDGGLDRGDIDVQGWVEDSSSIVFSSLSAYDYAVAEGEAFVQLTLDGNTAYMTEVGTGTGIWAVTANASVTVPTAPILSIIINGNDAEISFAAEDGLSYQLQKRTSLTSGVWGNVGSPVVNSGGGTETLIDTGTLPTNTEGFYQVIVN